MAEIKKDNAQEVQKRVDLVENVMKNELILHSKDAKGKQGKLFRTFLIPLRREQEGAKESDLDQRPQLKALLRKILPEVRLSELGWEAKRGVRLGVFDDVVTVGLPYSAGSMQARTAVVLAVSMLDKKLAEQAPSIGMKIDSETINNHVKMKKVKRVVNGGAFWEAKSTAVTK